MQEHLHLLSISEKVIEELIKYPIIQEVATPTLLHPDIHKRNIYLAEEDPSCVTAIIDWQSASIEPIFVYANQIPDMADDPTADLPMLEKSLSSLAVNVLNVVTTEGDLVESPEE